jgi:hypothetical protein
MTEWFVLCCGVLAGLATPGTPGDLAVGDRVRIEVVGCESLVDHDCDRLARFRFAYAWESAEQVERRLETETRSEPTPAQLAWTSGETDADGRAGLPVPPDVSGRYLLHVRIAEKGWDWFTFPGPRLPGTLEGANAFELQPGQRSVRWTLVEGQSPDP